MQSNDPLLNTCYYTLTVLMFRLHPRDGGILICNQAPPRNGKLPSTRCQPECIFNNLVVSWEPPNPNPNENNGLAQYINLVVCV